jgi:Zn-dependent peptidase ImmA (M78 family)
VYAPTGPSNLRLVTRANDWQQAASRAFAAELLAPAEALAARLQDPVDWETAAADLAREFQVSEWVIHHQAENHGLD